MCRRRGLVLSALMRWRSAPGSRADAHCRRGSANRPWLSPAPRHGANDPPARRILLRTEHVLDPDADFALLSVSFDLCVRQRVVPGCAAMDAAFEAALIELGFCLSRAVGAVSVHIPRRVGDVQQPIQLLAVVH